MEYADGANVLGSTSEGRLHAMLTASSDQGQVKRIVTGIMTGTQAWKYILTLDSGKAAKVSGWLSNSAFLDGLKSSTNRSFAFGVPAMLGRAYDLVATNVGAVGPLLSNDQLIDAFMHSKANMAAIVGDGTVSASLKTALTSIGAVAYNKVFDCGDDKIIKVVMDLFTGTELQSISSASSQAVKDNLERLAD